jgi:hypothetical protein
MNDLPPQAQDSPDSETSISGSTAPSAAAAFQSMGPSAQVHYPTAEARSVYVYAIGRIEPRFPTLGVEKEFAQATGRALTAGLTDRQAVHAVLSESSNRYLVRRLCWAFTIESQDTYVLVPHDVTDLDMLIDAVRPTPSTDDIDVVIGTLGPPASPDLCNGLVVPLVRFHQIYSFDRESFLDAVPRPDHLDLDDFRAGVDEMFSRIQRLADNAGSSDEHRALNYLALRYPAIYSYATEKFNANSGLSGVEVRRSTLSGIRSIVDVIFTFTDRSTGVPDKSATQVDVTEEFPFLVSGLAPYTQH